MEYALTSGQKLKAMTLISVLFSEIVKKVKE